MKKYKMALFFLGATLLTACSSGSDYDWDDSDTGSGTGQSSASSSSSVTTNSDLSNLDVEIDTTALTESETVPSDDEDYVENYTISSTIYIVYDGSSATTSGSADGVDVSISGADVTVTSTAANVNYVLSGTSTDGSFKMSSSSTKKFEITLNGLTLTNSDGPAINIQTGKRCYMVATDGTTNTLADGSSYASSDEDQKGTIFSEGQLIFSGSGRISVDANVKAGIASDDYILIRPNTNIYVNASEGNGIKANDGIIVRGGVVNVVATGTAAKGLSTDASYTQEGGRVTAITSGGGTYDSDEKDVSACAGVKADSIFTISGGELNVKSTGKGGKGISCDMAAYFDGGTVTAVTTGSTYTYTQSLDSKAKGIKADGDIQINGGNVMVKTTGGDGCEGMESKGAFTINGGTTEIYAYDDAINAAYDLTVNGGYVYAFSVNNDGMDANHNLYIKGGTTLAYGTTSPECGIDANEESGYSLIVTGGTLMAVGGGESYPSSSSTQPSIVYGGSVSSGATLVITSGTSDVASFVMGRSYSGSVCFLFTAPDLTKGSSYTLTADGVTLGTVSSLSLPYSSIGSTSGSMGTGGMGGGGMWH